MITGNILFMLASVNDLIGKRITRTERGWGIIKITFIRTSTNYSVKVSGNEAEF